MAHHAYVYSGNQEAGIRASRSFAETELNLSGTDNPDIAVFTYGLFSVDDVRRISRFATQTPVNGGKKLIVLAAGRLFHEAQNALLKLFEEPTEDTTLLLIVPSEGILLPTLRSRLLPLPGVIEEPENDVAVAFLKAGKAEREKSITKLLARTKADKDEEKQVARLEAVMLLEGITRSAYDARVNATGAKAHDLDLLLRDLDRFVPMLHDRSAPLKLIFEHLLIVLPEKL